MMLQKTPMVRLAKILVNSSRLEEYKDLLKEEAESSVQMEPGVLTLYAVSEKGNLHTFYYSRNICRLSSISGAFTEAILYSLYKTSTDDVVTALELF